MPASVNGKICYLEIPSIDVAKSADFYSKTFGWNLRRRGDGATTFDDATGEVSGAFVTGREAMTRVGLLFYVMVDSVATACNAVVANGGSIVQPIGVDAPEITARFADPAGNIIGLYQEPTQQGST
jgi:predicted enzyme related to lactoylglutathione lyase